MTFKVNIEHGTSLYTTDELISYGLSGCLYAGEVCLQELIEKIVDEPMTKEEEYTEDILRMLNGKAMKKPVKKLLDL